MKEFYDYWLEAMREETEHSRIEIKTIKKMLIDLKKEFDSMKKIE